jgi:ketosteroid isomerase-like protein
MDNAPAPVTTRGSEALTRGISGADETRMISFILRAFYYPLDNQARWVDPRPLAHERNAAADSAMQPDEDRAEIIVQSVNLRRVCELGGKDDNCRGRPGGVLRFSRAYAMPGHSDSALVYAAYRPVQYGIESELEFRMARNPRGWHIASKRTLEQTRVRLTEQTPQSVADELLAADRAFAAAAERVNVIEGISAMLDDSVIMQIPAPTFARGKPAAVASLRSNADNERSRMTWTPVRAGISADGRHGFTYGYATLVRPDSTRVPLKYLAYWIKGPAGWRVAAYKRRPRPAGEVPMQLMSPSLPASLVAATLDSNVVKRHRASVMAAEKEFSDTAQTIGIGPAFERFGRRADAMNMGGPIDTAFVIGSPAIGRSIGAGYPGSGSPVSWASDYDAIVASSGDLGVTFGFIRPNASPAAGQQPQVFPFFTIWRREPGGRWLYIAE